MPAVQMAATSGTKTPARTAIVRRDPVLTLDPARVLSCGCEGPRSKDARPLSYCEA